MGTAIANPAAGLLEQVLIGGDLSKLNTQDRVMYYKQVCESVGLNPLTKPFEYITLNGKLTLYALRSCTEQLRQLHGVSVEIKAREVVEGCYVVTAQAQDARGRHDESIGVVPIDKVIGEARSNAMMKAETKAKRRVTLSICGLGWLDETEEGSVQHERITPSAGSMQALPIETHEVVMETAAEVKSLLANDQAQDAYALWQNSKFDADETVAFWSQLDSKQKGVLGRMGEAERAAAAGTISEPQKKRLEARIKELGLDRDEVKAHCVKTWGVAHFSELTKEQYATLDASLEPSNAAASKSPPAPPSGDAAAPTQSDDCRACLQAVDSVKGQKGAQAVQQMIDQLENDAERKACQDALDWQVRQLKAKSQTRKDADRAVAEIANDLPFKPTQAEL